MRFKTKKMPHTLTKQESRFLIDAHHGTKLRSDGGPTIRSLEAKGMLRLGDDGSFVLTILGAISARVLIYERRGDAARAAKKAAHVVAVALGLLAPPAVASATCAPSDIIGQWHIKDIYTDPFHWYGQAPVTINAAGTMSGSLASLDQTGIQGWKIKSTSPIKVDVNCKVTGNFAIYYGSTDNKPYAFRAFMSRDKNEIGDLAIAWPGFDTLPIQYAVITIKMARF